MSKTKHKSNKVDPEILNAIKDIFPNAKITVGYKQTMKEMKRLKSNK